MSVRIEASPEVLDVFISGWDRFFGLRGRIEIPMCRVLPAQAMPADEVKADLLIRTGGLGLPGVAAVGHFRGRTAKRQWWRVYRADEVLVVDLAPTSRFDRIVLQVDRPEETAAQIESARTPPRSSDG